MALRYRNAFIKVFNVVEFFRGQLEMYENVLQVGFEDLGDGFLRGVLIPSQFGCQICLRFSPILASHLKTSNFFIFLCFEV